MLNEIVTATNAYAAIRLNNKQLTNNSTFYKWKDVTLQELKAYLGVILKMAMTEKPDVKDCFSKEWTEYSPFFLDIFSRRRFLQIHWMLHLKSLEPTTVPITRKSKVSNVVSYIQDKCLHNYTPRQRIAVDESTVGFKGRIAFKTYNPQKPTKWRSRVYVLSENFIDSENGCVSAFKPYFGKLTTENLVRPDLPFTTRIALQLAQQVLNKAEGSGYHLYTNRFYTSIPLAMKFHSQNIHLTGTIQKNRVGLPIEVKKLKLKNLETKVYPQ